MSEVWKQWEGHAVNGKFHLRHYLGGSDHSAVFLTELGEQEPQRAAIKLIPAHPENAELQLSSWELAANLSHPHLVRIFQMGRCQLAKRDLLYVVIDYAEETLSQVLRHRPLTPAESQDMLASVLDALAYIHGKGFVHGHLKPANIMAVDDQLKISSDGLCGVGKSSGLGKPSVYDPPETESGEISPAADAWSLGMTVVEALTQHLPVWDRAGQAEPTLAETLPAPFLEIVHHCLRRDPKHRWTVADIAARLHSTSPMPQKQTAAGPQRRLAKWRYMVPAVAFGLAVAAMLVAPRLLKRHPEAPRAPSISVEQSRVQPEPVQGPGTSETGQPDAVTKTPTDSLVRGGVVHQVLPDVPQSARDTIQGTVRVGVRVAVDPSGNVVKATFDSPGPSRYFADLALQAARRWKFAPAKVDGQNISSDWILRFEFERTATMVLPARAAP